MKKIISLLLCMSLLSVTGTTAFAANESIEKGIIPSGLYLEADGTLFVTDFYDQAVWSQKDGVFTRMTGDTQKEALLQSPWAIAPYQTSYGETGYAVTDTEHHALRFLTNGKLSTLAGNQRPGSVNGYKTNCSFQRPTGLASDGNGNLYIADTGNHVIRRLDAAGNVTTYAGSVKGRGDGSLLSASFYEPTGLYFSDGVLYVADSGNHRICKIEQGQVTTVAGMPQEERSDGAFDGGYRDGPAASALFQSPQGLAVAGDAIYVADTGNSAIRKIQQGTVSTLMIRSDTDDLYPVSPRSIAVSGDQLLVSDIFAKEIFTLPRS